MLSTQDKKKLDHIGGLALSTRPTLEQTFEFSETCIIEGIPGDFVECGVFAGSQCAAMAYACQKHGDDRKVHLFDSFQGIPKATIEDGEQGKKIEGKSICSIDQVKQYMNGWSIEPERLVYHEGWFQETIPGITGDIAILRIDCDMYWSTLYALMLYPSLVKGGYCIIDDYALPGCRSAVEKYFGFQMPDIEETVGGMGVVYWRKKE